MFLCDVVLAAFVCTLAIQTATTRMIYSMSRDEVLPFSRHRRKVSTRGGATVQAPVLVGVLAAALLLINLGHAGAFTALTSTCIVLLYLAYLCVTVPMLDRRLKGEGTRSSAGRGRQAGLQPRPVGAADQHRRRAVRHRDGDQPGLDPAVGIRPHGEQPGAAVLALIILAITVVGGVIAFAVKKRDYRQAISVLPSSVEQVETELPVRV